MKKQRILSLLLALAMVFSLLPASAMAVDVKTFDDVSEDAWYYKYVDFVTDKEYFVGTSQSTFSPEMSMTRAMFVTVLAALENVKVDNNVSPFDDVPANTWYSGAVAWAAEKGVVAGIGGGKFAPEAAISREQMAVMMDAYVKWHAKMTGKTHVVDSKIDKFGDADKISDWAEKSVERCRNWGLIEGMPDGNFWPQNTASRAEVATVIYNLAWLLGGGGGGGTGDGGGHTTHTYGDWTQTKAPTCTEKGEETRYCTYIDCTAFETREIDVLDHKAGDPVKENEVAATCTTPGSYDEVVYCSVCGTELSRDSKTIALAEHTPGNPVQENVVASSCTSGGSYDEVIYCSVCGTEMSRVNKTVAPGEHFPAAPVKENEVAATCTTPGSYDEVIYCQFCGTEMSRESKTTGLGNHVPGTSVKEDHIAPTETTEGCYDMVVYCSVCGTELKRTHNPIDALGSEVVYTDYIYNALKATIEDIYGDIKDNTGVSYIPTGGDAYWKDAYVKITGVELGDKNAVGSTEHPINIAVTADMGSDALKSIVKFSTVNAVKLVGGLGYVAANVDKADLVAVKAELEKLVAETIDALEEQTGIDITWSKACLAEIAEYVYDVCKEEGSNAYDYGMAYVDSLRKHFLHEGKYVTGDVTISVGDYNVVIDVTETSATVGSSETAHKIIDAAVDVAIKLNHKLNGADVKFGYYAEKVAAVVEAKGIKVPDQTLIALVEEVYNYCASKQEVVKDDAKVLYALADAHADKAAAVAKIAVGMAKEMYWELKGTSEYTNLNDIKLDTTVNVKFSGMYDDATETDVKSHTDMFPYDYPVTFSMQMEKMGNTTLGDNIQYKYENGHNFNVIITDSMQQAAKDKIKAIWADETVQAMWSDIKSTLKSMIKSYIGDVDLGQMTTFSLRRSQAECNLEVYNKINSAVGSTMVDGLTKLGMHEDEAETTVQAQLVKWVNANFDANATLKDALMDMIEAGDVSVDNTALYELVDIVCAQATEYLKNSTYGGFNAFDFLKVGSQGLTLNEFIESMEAMAADLEMEDKLAMLKDFGLERYAMAYVFDEMHKDSDTGELLEGFPCYAEQEKAGMTAAIDKLVVKSAAEEVLEGKVDPDKMDQTVDTVVSAVEVITTIQTLQDMKNDKDWNGAAVTTLPLTSIANIMQNEDLVNKLPQSTKDKSVGNVTALVALIPDGYSINLPNGSTMTAESLDALRNAKTVGEVIPAMGKVLEEAGDLSLKEFIESEQKISLKGLTGTFSFGLKFDLQ